MRCGPFKFTQEPLKEPQGPHGDIPTPAGPCPPPPPQPPAPPMDPPYPHHDPGPLQRPDRTGPPPVHTAPRPARSRPTVRAEALASRPGRSRVPGRDHRRYYHERWRAEYLMEFNAARPGLLCLVCGRGLATLKLSTIKRHIRQRHPYSSAWGVGEKQQLLRSWDARQGAPPRPETDPTRGCGTGSPSRPRRRGCPRVPCPRGGAKLSSPPPGADSLRRWLRAELRLDLEAGGLLRCLLCARALPSLHLADIRSHALAAHPGSLIGPSRAGPARGHAPGSLIGPSPRHAAAGSALRPQPGNGDAPQADDEEGSAEAEAATEGPGAGGLPPGGCGSPLLAPPRGPAPACKA